MGIDTVHPLYTANIEFWSRCRDAYDGEDAVKNRGIQYLPRVDPSQDGDEYRAYKTRALFYEAVGRTIDGFVGAIARKPPVIKLPAKLANLEDDVTADGVSLQEFIKKNCEENLLIGRGGVLVDYDDKTNSAYLRLYQAEEITNWFGDGSVVLREQVWEPKPDDQFDLQAVTQYRQLSIIDGAYTVTIWRKTEAAARIGSAWTVYETIVPSKRGSCLAEIPFFWLSTMGPTTRIEKPPLLGLVNVCLSHYRSSADLEHGRHFTGMPTLWISGFESDTPIRVGAAAAITLRDPAAKVGYAEFTGQGLGSLENALEEKERQMAVLGAAVFQTTKKAGVEAAETARIRTGSETSLLMGIVSAVEQTLTKALQCAAEWMGATGEVSIALNREFIDVTLEPQTLVGLVGAFQAGALSHESFLYSLQQAEMLPPDTDIGAEVIAAQNGKIARDTAQQKVQQKSAV